jgi:hypothetical protein
MLRALLLVIRPVQSHLATGRGGSTSGADQPDMKTQLIGWPAARCATILAVIWPPDKEREEELREEDVHYRNSNSRAPDWVRPPRLGRATDES